MRGIRQNSCGNILLCAKIAEAMPEASVYLACKYTLLEEAIRDSGIDLSQRFSVGDKPRDCTVC